MFINKLGIKHTIKKIIKLRLSFVIIIQLFKNCISEEIVNTVEKTTTEG